MAVKQLGAPIYKSTERAGGMDISKGILAGVPSGDIAAILKAQEQAKVEEKKAEDLRTLRRETERISIAANRQLNIDLRNAKNRQDAQNARNKFDETLGKALTLESAKKVQSGIINVKLGKELQKVGAEIKFVHTRFGISEAEQFQRKQVISQRQIDTFRGVPVYETIITDDKGKFIRKPTKQEEEVARKSKLTVTIPQEPEILEKDIQDINRRKRILETQLTRKNLSVSERIKLNAESAAITFAESLISEGVRVIKLPSTFLYLIKNPRALLEVPAAIKEGGLSAGQFLRTTDPGTFLGKVGGEIIVLQGRAEGLKIIGKVNKNLLARLNPKFKGVKTTSLGIQEIKGVKKVGDIEIIPPRGTKLKVDPKQAVKEAMIEKQLKPIPIFPKTTKLQKDILSVVKERGDVVTGSFAQQTLLKKQFAREFKDLDILTKNRPALIEALKRKLGNKVIFKKKFKSIEVFFGKKQIADLVKFDIGEEGFVKKFGITTHKGLKLAKIEARLAAKVFQLGIGKRGKVVRDIRDIFGKKVDLDIPAIKGSFGYSKKELRKVIGKEGAITTAQIDLLAKGIFKPDELELKRFLYASPFEAKTGKAQLRISRLGLGEGQEASFMDLLVGDVSFKKGKPQIFIFPKERVFELVGKKLKKQVFSETKGGFVVPEFSSELEVVLGKGFAIKKGKVLATTIIEGEKVPIIELEKIKLSKGTQNLFKDIKNIESKISKEKLSKAQKTNLANEINYKRNKLIKDLKKETNFDYGSDFKKSKKVFPIKRKITSLITSLLRVKPSSKIISPILRRTPSIPTRLITSSIPTRSIKRIVSMFPSRPISKRLISRPPSRPISKRLISRPPYKPPIRPPILKLGTKKFKTKIPKLPKQSGYNVYVKEKNRFLKANLKPLERNRALDLAAYVTDKSLAASWKIKQTNMKAQKPFEVVPLNYAQRTANKFRTFRIVKGRRVPLQDAGIEYRKFRLDTGSEVRKIQAARFIKQLPKRLFKPVRKLITIKRKNK